MRASLASGAEGAVVTRKSAIVTIRRRSRFGYVEDLTEEEANRRADAANAMMQDSSRRTEVMTR